LASVAAGPAVARGHKPPAPTFKPTKFQGAKTVGTPDLKELRVAASSGKLRTNRKGYVTTPQVRQTSHRLKRLRRRYAKEATPQIQGLHNKAQEEFAETLSKRTKIPPKLAGEWVKQESGASSAGQGGEAGEQNQLGVGYPAHPTSFSQSSYFNNTTPRKAAIATAKWMEGKIGARYGYKAAPSITGIPKLAKAGAPEEEIRAYIEGPSAWGTGRISQSGVTASKGHANPELARKLRQTQAKARKLGLNVSGASKVGPAPKRVVTRYKAARVAMKEIEGTPYVYGAGHGAIEDNPSALDCSGAVSYVLAKAGVLKAPLTSGAMGEVLKPGPGAITVFYNADHTFLYDAVKKEFWGTSVGDSGAGGLGPHPRPSDAYLAGYNVGHVPGLGKKQALQLGASGVPSAPTSFPGMTLSASGTTATVDPSATATRDKPGFSKSPIKLTPNQKAHRTLKKLEQLGAGVSQPSSGETEDKGAILAELERRYGSKAA